MTIKSSGWEKRFDKIISGLLFPRHSETKTFIKSELARQRKETIRKIEAIDPLEAIADWDNGDDIAHSVKGYIICKLKEFK